MRLIYLLSDNSFQFSGTCTSAEKLIKPSIAMLNTNDYTCNIDPVNNIIIATINGNVLFQ